MNFEIKWDSQMEGLEISFTVEGELHRSLLSWTRLEEMRQEMVRDIWKLVPKITEGVGSAPDERNPEGGLELGHA